MTLDQRLTRAVRQVADGVTPPEVDLDRVRDKARANRRLAITLTVSAAVAAVMAVVAVSTAIGINHDSSAPVPPAGPDPSESIDVDLLPDWLGNLSAGSPPLTPYWHDGVLHVRGIEIETPFPVGEIEVAGDTVLIGGHYDRNGDIEDWALVRGDQLETFPSTGGQWPRLSIDGKIAFWQTNPTPDTTRFVTWDTETSTELASRTVPGNFDGSNDRLQLVGIDSDGIAYWVDQAKEHPLTRWDVRADTVEPTDLAFDFAKTFDNQVSPIPDLWVGFEDAYVSPDGTREVFTGPVPGDAPQDCCAAQLRVRPVGPVESIDPGEVTSLQLPEGIPEMRLWDAQSDRGMWWVWWETNETLLLDASREGQSFLVRCSTTSGTCESVLDLGTNSNEGILYLPDWEQDWAFARFPLSS